MANCKLCGVVLMEKSVATGDRKMCKRCYSNLSKYRRWQTRVDTITLSATQEAEVNRLEKMFISNMAAQRYVPKCFLMERVDRICETCDGHYSTSSGLKLCSECYTKEQAYIMLVARESVVSPINSKRAALQRYEAEYAVLHNSGKRVPKLYIRRHTNV